MNKITRFSFFILLIYIVLPCYAQNRVTREIIDFEAVYVKGPIEVELIPSSSRELSITSRFISIEDVEVEFKNKAVHIKTRIKINNEENVQVKLPYEKINTIEATGGAIVNSARDIEMPELSLTVGTGGKIELSVQTRKIEAKVSHVSDIILYGITENQVVDVNSGGNYLAYDLECKNTVVKATAGSQAKVTASESIDATSNSKAFVGYIGNPAKTAISTSLGGEIMSYKTREELEK